MSEPEIPHRTLRDAAELWCLRFVARGLLPGRWFGPAVPPPQARTARTGPLRLEIVSHCWRYAHLLAYQLSSLVLHPPARLSATMTVLHAPEDASTTALLARFAGITVPGVRWNWQAMPREELFRRGIGRNRTARATRADWIWFTDCDVVFHRGCLDALADALQGRRAALLFPRVERCTDLLDPTDPMLHPDLGASPVLDIDPSRFTPRPRDRATGPLQIAHGDVARACGYCENLRVYQKPSAVWTKATEDRAFRWLLGTQGTPIDLPGVHRIRHANKGRYSGSRAGGLLRGGVRRLQSWFRDRAAARGHGP